jgi:hypothetical protein
VDPGYSKARLIYDPQEKNLDSRYRQFRELTTRMLHPFIIYVPQGGRIFSALG